MPFSKRSITMMLSLFAAIFLILFAAEPSIFAVTVDEYQQRVKAVKARADGLFRSMNDGRNETGNIDEIVAPLPASEKIDWPYGSIDADNRWLREYAERYKAAQTDEDRGMILTQMSERLAAISDSIDKLNGAAEAEQTKDQDKQKLAEVLRREEYQKPQENEESLIEKWLDEFLEWLLGVFPRSPIDPSEASGLGSLQLGLQILLYAVVIGFIGFFLYKIAPLVFRRFESRERKDKKHRVILGERIEADKSASDLFSEAESLARSGDIRAAIRKGYIALLCDLSDRKVIRLAHHKTNRDYLRDLRNNAGLFENVNGLTTNFERNWYGLRTASETDWHEFRAHYLRTIAEVKAEI